jgi:hypothetical protein
MNARTWFRPGVLPALLVAFALAVTLLAVSAMAAQPTAIAGRAARAQDPKVSALVRILGVLRRPQTHADLQRDPFGDSSAQAGLTPVLSLQRLATTTSWGTTVYLVPLVKTSANGLPLNPSRGGLGISINGSSGACCDTARQVEAGKASVIGEHPWYLIMVVPDSVHRISVALNALRGQRPPPPVTGTVHSNIAAVLLRHTLRPGRGAVITWYAASGAVIKTIHP